MRRVGIERWGKSPGCAKRLNGMLRYMDKSIGHGGGARLVGMLIQGEEDGTAV